MGTAELGDVQACTLPTAERPLPGGGVNRQTLRYYERRGLVAEPARTCPLPFAGLARRR